MIIRASLSLACHQSKELYPYIVASAATVTVFKFIDFTNMTAAKLAQIIANFTNLNAVIFADYLESDVSSALYQQADLV